MDGDGIAASAGIDATVIECYVALTALTDGPAALAPYQQAGVDRALCSLWQVLRGLGVEDGLPAPQSGRRMSERAVAEH